VEIQHPRAGEPPVEGEQRPPAPVLELIRRPYVAEVLAALDERPHTLAGLRAATGAPRRHAVAALRALAAHQAITRTPAGTWDAGTWDAADDRRVRYRLTPAGHALIDRLFRLEVWRAVYEPDRSPPTV
jgi:DNA-binding HxlR family transcriptional regulator